MIKYFESKHILQTNKTLDWFGAEYCANLYRGCSHGCIYCDSRSSCYQDFEFDIIKPKRNAISILEDELSRKCNNYGILYRMSDIIQEYQTAYDLKQLSLFDFISE